MLTLKALWKPGLDFEGLLLPTPTEQQRPEKKQSNQPLGLTGQVRNSEWERLEKSTEANIWSSLKVKQKNVSKGTAS